MARKIPVDFDVRTIDLDPNESRIRDEFRLDITNWVKFRHTINIGIHATVLSSPTRPIPNHVEQAYIELGKSHSEVITSLGSAKLSLDLAIESHPNDHLLFKKSYKDFYFHHGCLLDNLARIIYIVNDPQSAVARYPNGTRKGKRAGQLIRHWISWSELGKYRGYWRLKKSKSLGEIINIRNGFTHGWMPSIFSDRHTGILYWPIAIRTKRNFYWPYDEHGLMRRAYRKKMPILDMMTNDLSFIAAFQNQVFGKLVRNINLFEQHYNVKIE